MIVSLDTKYSPRNTSFEMILSRRQKNNFARKIPTLFGYQFQLSTKILKYPNFSPILLEKSILYEVSQPILIF